MGKLTGGIDYDMIGKTGNHVGRRVKGVNIISMKPAKSNRPPTPLQYDQRLKFGLLTSWLRKAIPILDIGYQHYESEMTAYNMAVSENLKYAVTGVTPNFSINYPMARFSKGTLRKPSDIVVVAAAAEMLEFSWVNVVGQSNSKGTDQIAIVVYSPALDEFVLMENAAVRSAESYELQLPLDWAAELVHSWMIAVSVDGKLVSDSSYVGQVTVV
jgi:hypothetical protein